MNVEGDDSEEDDCVGATTAAKPFEGREAEEEEGILDARARGGKANDIERASSKYCDADNKPEDTPIADAGLRMDTVSEEADTPTDEGGEMGTDSEVSGTSVVVPMRKMVGGRTASGSANGKPATVGKEPTEEAQPKGTAFKSSLLHGEDRGVSPTKRGE